MVSGSLIRTSGDLSISTDGVSDLFIGRKRRVRLGSKDTVLETSDTSLLKVDLGRNPKEVSVENDEEADIEDTVEGGFRIELDNITTLRQTPSDRVEKQEQDSTGGNSNRVLRNQQVIVISSLSVVEQQAVADNEKADNTKGKVTPLVSRVNQTTNQERNNSGFLGNNSEQGIRPWQANESSKVNKEGRESKEVSDPSGVKDLAETGEDCFSAGGDMVKLGLNISPTQIRSLGKVLDRKNKQAKGGKLVEKTFISVAEQGKGKSANGGDCKQGEGSPVPVRTMIGNVEVKTVRWVDLNSLVSRSSKQETSVRLEHFV